MSVQEQATPPTSTPWVPVWGGQGLAYKGDWVAGTYQDGDVVVKDGTVYMCVGGPTTVAPDPAPWGASALVPPRFGDYAELITDWNNARKNGWYMGTMAANQPPALSNWAIGEVIAHNDIWVTQRAWDFTSIHPFIYERRYLNGGWNPWVLIGAPGIGTSLPASPVDGQEFILVDILAAATWQWRLRYNGNHTGTYKWEFVGGAPFTKYVAASEGTTSGTPSYVNLATPMEFTLPRAGNYLLEGSVGEFASTVGPGSGAVLAVQSNGVTIEQSSSETGGEKRSIWVRGIVNGAAAGHVVALRFAGVSGTTSFQRRLFTVQPLRVS